MLSKARLNLLKEKGKTVKVGRNDPCPCGSGIKYKRCCLGKDIQVNREPGAVYARSHKIRLKEEADIEGIRKAGQLVLDTFEQIEDMIRPGVKTDKINTIVHEFTIEKGAQPAPLNYRGFPKSVCVSINEEVCHGIPGKRVLADGDIVNVDITSVLNGYYADANKTFFAGTPGADARKIVSVAKECLKRGISMVKPGNTVGDIGWAIQTYAENQGCSVVRDFVGHGVGFEFHESPQIPHFGQKGQGIRLIPGMVFTIEPMINLGNKELKILADNWTAVTRDGSLSAQFEQTILVTQSGYESLTPYELS
jgi:methionyl aminopeptidase